MNNDGSFSTLSVRHKGTFWGWGYFETWLCQIGSGTCNVNGMLLKVVCFFHILSKTKISVKLETFGFLKFTIFNSQFLKHSDLNYRTQHTQNSTPELLTVFNTQVVREIPNLGRFDAEDLCKPKDIDSCLISKYHR